MLGTLALVAAVLFVVLAVARLRGSVHAAPRIGAPATAALAAVLAFLQWSATGDSRWLVGAVLMLGAAGLSLVAAGRGVAIATIVLAVLGAALFGVATASPMRLPVVTTA